MKDKLPHYQDGLRQNLPKNLNGITHVLGGDNGSKEPNLVLIAYNAYQERERQGWARLLGGF